jgi:hypothetical protein
MSRYAKKGEEKMRGEVNAGGISQDKTRLYKYLEAIRVSALDSKRTACLVSKVSTIAEDESVLRLIGQGFTPNTKVYAGGKFFQTTFISNEEIRIIKPTGEFASAQLIATNQTPFILDKTALSSGSERLTIKKVSPVEDLPLRTAHQFALIVEFETAGFPVKFAKLEITFPDGTMNEQKYPVSSRESRAGQKIIKGFIVERGGVLKVRATLYDNGGNADYFENEFDVVPSNPVQLYVYTEHGAPSGRGGAQYNSGDNRYYCYGRWVISNGNSHSVTITSSVRCRVTDAGLGELADFNFNIGSFTIPGNSSTTIYVYTWHGSSSDVYDLFRDFGDAKFEFWLNTSEGTISDWNVWAACAQVGVTANFVGDFSGAEAVKIRDIIDTWSTAIYSNVDCIFSLDTPLLEIPRNHSDWDRYRVIRVEEEWCGSACTDSDEADDMRDDWSAPSAYNNRIDIFFVESFNGDPCASSIGGFSPEDGPSSKGGSKSGCVIDVKDLNILTSSWGEQVMGIVIAHEVGHYLGLKGHSSASNNFMNASVGSNNTGIQYSQWKTMRDHFFVRKYNP